MGVKCANRKMWGTKVFGLTGAIYAIAEGGALSPDPTEADAAEFGKFDAFRVGPVVPPAPAPPGKSGDKIEAAAEDDPKGVPGEGATADELLAWAKAAGVALSASQKRLEAGELRSMILSLTA